VLSAEEIIGEKGFFAKGFPIESEFKVTSKTLDFSDIPTVSDTFVFHFENAGYMNNGMIYTAKVEAVQEAPITMGQMVQSNVDEKYYLGENLDKWDYLKGAKRINRTSKSGHEYVFSEGAISFPDKLDAPARTMLTSESSLNRSTHVIADPGTGRLRLLTPVEAERIQGFDDDWTNTGMPERFRYFCMGNALVVPLITRMGKVLNVIFEEE
jgi:DNA (cytosine-5)-methyltransferase 1